ncbi:hypothetical protein LJK88_16255 [Paenibacillus sp. P26]|nr:hypothetical protein LJK88_16255 [Paenibacillus sp. P26]
MVAFNAITARVLEEAPKLKIVCKHGVGVDNIDLAAPRRGKYGSPTYRMPTGTRSPILPSRLCFLWQDKSRRLMILRKKESGRASSVRMCIIKA